MKRFYTLLLLPILLVGCLKDDQARFKDRMEGTWIIDETITHIYPDGRAEVASTTPSVGTLLLERSDFDDGVFLDYTLTLNNSSYSWNRKPFKTDEGRKRVFFYYFYCEELFNCDMVATIEEDKANSQVWNFYRVESGYHRKVHWKLRREE